MGAAGSAVEALKNRSNAKYEILRVVNRGGMGEIALGRVVGTKGFEKLVVLKRLRADAERADHRAMFDVEAELMSRIEHPNIVQVFDQPIIENVPYLAMAYVRGRNLDQVVRKIRNAGNELPPLFALTVMADVLRGLAFIHRLKDADGTPLGVVHQDITPSNILVSFFGEIKITDFGIAYVTSRDGGLRKGVLKGKPRYVAPEVLAGRRVNNRVDIYGVAVVLYEMLKSRALFARPKVQETLQAVAKNTLPDFANDLPNVSDGVHQLMQKALAKDPNDRYRSAEEMAQAIAMEIAGLGGPMSPARLGHYLRELFKGDQDAPEVDADVDDGSLSIFPPAFKSPDLEQTLSELDRLLGAESSSDLFALPPEIAKELEDLVDMEPFPGATPLPELALAGPNAEELLLQASLSEPLFAPRIPPPPLSAALPPSTALPPPSTALPPPSTALPPPSTALPPPRGSRPPLELAHLHDDPLTEPSRRTTRPPTGRAVDGHAISEDIVPGPRSSTRIPVLAGSVAGPAAGSVTGSEDLDDSVVRRNSVIGSSTGEYSITSQRPDNLRRETPLGGGLTELTPSAGYRSISHEEIAAEITPTIDTEIQAADFISDIPAESTQPNAPTVSQIAEGSLQEQKRVQIFVAGLLLGVILGGVIGALIVMQLS